MTEKPNKATSSVKATDFELPVKEQAEQIQQVQLSKLATFENHPFHVTQDEDFQKLVDSIKENGVLIPAIARPKGDGYELISGHRRKLAAAIAGLDVIQKIPDVFILVFGYHQHT